jgi:Predicted Fe-S oxidoreductases
MYEDNVFSTGAKKLLHYAERIQQWQDNRPIVPITLEIQPSERCNHNCPNCQSHFILGQSKSRKLAHHGSFLDLSLLNSIWNLPPAGIVISGNTGDPLLHPNIASLISTIHDHSIPMVVITNGQALHSSLSELIIKYCSGIRISLDASNAATYSLTHGVNSKQWGEVCNKVAELCSLKLRDNNSKCLIGVGFLTSEQTRNWMVEATIQAKAMGAGYIQFRPFHYDFTCIDEEFNVCKSFEDKDFKVMRSFQKYSNLGDCSGPNNCQAAWFYTVLDAKGDFYLCCHNIGNEKAKIGSLREENWQTFIDSDFRRETINNYSTLQCIPNCRLHSQNSILFQMASGSTEFRKPELDDEVILHAPFL